MGRSFSWAVFWASVFMAVPAHAGSAYGRVVTLAVRSSDGLHYVVLDGPSSGQPSCATHPYFMIADEHSDAGKSQFAMLLSAYMSGKPVHIDGAGTCTRWGDGEDILAIEFQ